jgi:calcineurin-like phosphoesterase family protein
VAIIKWLHLSDLHFRQRDVYESEVVLAALLRDIQPLLGEEFTPIDLVFVTGDIAFAGRPEEYGLAEAFFERLLRTLSLQRARLFVVPGNHDVDRSLVGPATYLTDAILRDIHGPVDCRRMVAEVLTDDDSRRLVMRRLRGYEAFVNSYFPADHLRFGDSAYFYSKIVEVDGVSIAIYGLNSAWLSASDADRGRLILGERQVREAVAQTDGMPLRIALLHHPLEWFADFDRNQIEQYLVQNSDFVLHGHRHWQAFRQEKRPGAELCVFASGAGYEGRDLLNVCNAVKLDLSTGAGSAVSLRYSDEVGGFWVRDVLSYPSLRQEVYPFKYGRPYVPSLQRAEEKEPAVVDLLTSPLKYFDYVKQPGKLYEVLPEHIIDLARQAPQETVDFLEWMSGQDVASLRVLLSEGEGKLTFTLARFPDQLSRFQELRNIVVHMGSVPRTLKARTALYLVGPAGGGMTRQLTLQIPRKDVLRPRLAEQLRFSLYLISRTTKPVKGLRVNLGLSAAFLAYPYQGDSFLIEPSEHWQVSRSTSGAIDSDYAPPDEQPMLIGPEKDLNIGTAAIMVPWGEADGGPIELSIDYSIEAEEAMPVEGRLSVRILAALDFHEASSTGHVFEVPAAEENGIDTGLSVRRGQVMQFVARGVISYDAGYHSVNPDGFLCRADGELMRINEQTPVAFLIEDNLLMRGQRLAGLIGWVGDWEEGKAFFVGSSGVFTASSDGTLHLAVNDVRGTFGDNSGSFTVAVRAE